MQAENRVDVPTEEALMAAFSGQLSLTWTHPTVR
jgi:hypothetical protein